MGLGSSHHTYSVESFSYFSEAPSDLASGALNRKSPSFFYIKKKAFIPKISFKRSVRELIIYTSFFHFMFSDLKDESVRRKEGLGYMAMLTNTENGGVQPVLHEEAAKKQQPTKSLNSNPSMYGTRGFPDAC